MIFNHRLLCTCALFTATSLSYAAHVSIPVDITVINQSDHYIWLGHIKDETVVDTIRTRSNASSPHSGQDGIQPNPAMTETTSYYERTEKRRTAIVTLPPGRQFTYSQTSTHSSWWIFQDTQQPQGFYISNLNLQTNSFLQPTVIFQNNAFANYRYTIKEYQWLSFADHQLNIHPSYIEHTITIS